jgi:amino acid transporter
MPPSASSSRGSSAGTFSWNSCSGASVVAQGWSAYLGVFLGKLGIKIPEAVAYGSSFDLPALLLVAVLTALVAKGIKESMRVNLVLVAIKLFVVLFVIIAGIGFINTANYSPFIPPAKARRRGRRQRVDRPAAADHLRHLTDDVRGHGDLRRSLAGLLRLHRFRRRRDDRGRSPQPAA